MKEERYDTKMLRRRIEEQYHGNEAAFARDLGVDKSTVKRLLDDGRDWRGSKLMKAVELLNIPVEEINAYFFTPAVVEVQQEES